MSNGSKVLIILCAIFVIMLGYALYFYDQQQIPDKTAATVVTSPDKQPQKVKEANPPQSTNPEQEQDIKTAATVDPSAQKTFMVFFVCCGLLSRQVLPVERSVIKKKPLVEEAIEVLLLGPIEGERTSAYWSIEEERTSALWTAIPEGTRLIDLQISGKKISLTFNEKLEGEEVAGSAQYCALIRDQIEYTVKQFGFTEVIIKIPGKNPDEVLQP